MYFYVLAAYGQYPPPLLIYYRILASNNLFNVWSNRQNYKYKSGARFTKVLQLSFFHSFFPFFMFILNFKLHKMHNRLRSKANGIHNRTTTTRKIATEIMLLLLYFSIFFFSFFFFILSHVCHSICRAIFTFEAFCFISV